VRAAGVTIPICAGIMPVTNFKALNRMAAPCGIVLPDCDDAGALAAALRTLLAAPDRHRAMRAAARQAALAHSWPAMARQYLDLLQWAAARRALAATRILGPSHA